MTTQTKPALRLVELDSLRGLAAVAVLLFHLTYCRDNYGIGPFTFLAVDLKVFHYSVEMFFITSGFVIFMTLGAVTSSRQFLVSRVARLYPAYWISVIVTTAVAYLMERHPPSMGVFAVNMTMTETFFRTPYVDNSYWTLGVEIQFYVIIGVVFACGWIRRIDALCLTFLAAILVYRLTLLLAGIEAASWVEESFVEYGSFFVIGVCMFRLRNKDGSRLTLGIMLLAVLSTAWGGGHQSLSPGSIEYFAGTCALTGFMWLAVNDHFRFLRWRPLVFLGELSYPLYLVHQRIGVTLMEAFYRHGIHALIGATVATMAVGVLAYVIHISVEIPGRRYLRGLLAGAPVRRLPAAQVEGSVT
jgi:peptidoglycan/LPS O-acetylase OafA/YrhL